MSLLSSDTTASTTSRPQDEVWCDIPGFTHYQASDLGRVRSRKYGDWRVLVQTLHPNTGYLIVSLRQDGSYFARGVHRLVALTFLGEANGLDVNHRNGVKQDNRLCNLEYVTRGDNHRHAYRTGLRKPVRRKLSDADVETIRSLRTTSSVDDIADRFGVTKCTIVAIFKGKLHAKTHKENPCHS